MQRRRRVLYWQLKLSAMSKHLVLDLVLDLGARLLRATFYVDA